MESGGRAGGMMASLPHSWCHSLPCVTISTVPPGKSLGRTDHSYALGIGEFQTGYIIFQKVYIAGPSFIMTQVETLVGYIYPF